jgi:hypothetical protein
MGVACWGPGVLLRGRLFASLVWRVDFNLDGGEPSVRVWKSHDSMGYYLGKMKPEQPDVNGVRYAVETNLRLLYRNGEETVHALGRQPSHAGGGG